MRPYGLKNRTKRNHCGWGCCYSRLDQAILFGRNRRERRRIRRSIKRRERSQAKKVIEEELKNMGR
jgi:hypothetical protein